MKEKIWFDSLTPDEQSKPAVVDILHNGWNRHECVLCRSIGDSEFVPLVNVRLRDGSLFFGRICQSCWHKPTPLRGA